MDGRSSVRAVALTALSAAVAACGKGDTVVAPRLEATCAARPVAGSAPLLVSFTLAVSGAEGPFQVAVTYGDGTSGTDPDRPHTFVGAGAYTAAFTVSTASQSARCAVAIQVNAPVIVVPVPIVNTPPAAFFQTTPAAGPGDQIVGRAPFSVRFNMCGASDVDRDPLRWTMDFQGDGTLEVDGTTGADCRRDALYAIGTYRPRICVTDLGEDRQPVHPFQCKSYTVTATP